MDIKSSGFYDNNISSTGNHQVRRTSKINSSDENTDVHTESWQYRELRNFLSQDWSVVGVKYVFGTEIWIIRRIIWLSLVLFGVGFMVFQIRDRSVYLFI